MNLETSKVPGYFPGFQVRAQKDNTLVVGTNQKEACLKITPPVHLIIDWTQTIGLYFNCLLEKNKLSQKKNILLLISSI